MEHTALITNDAVVFGILACLLAFIFTTSSSKNPAWQKFYKLCPSLLLCYFLPSLLATFDVITPHGSKLYFVASRYLLPASLVLLTLSIDLKEVLRLGPKAIAMFFVGTVGIIVGGPFAIWIMSWIDPSVVGGAGDSEVWRGLAAVAGSWIGGGANMAAMKEVFGVSDDLFSQMIAVDVLIACAWMALLFYFAGNRDQVDAKLKADNSVVKSLEKKMEDFQLQSARIPSMPELMTLCAIGFGLTAVAHFCSDLIAPYISTHMPELKKYSLGSGFFWIVVIATTGGMLLSFTKVRNLEGAGASKLGSVFLYFLVAVIGMEMNIAAVFDNPGIFAVGAIWLGFHAVLMFVAARLLRAPLFLLAVGSEANVGGAASAPIMASAFNPALAPIGVLMAVLGYALGTYGAWLCGILMQKTSEMLGLINI